MLAIYTYNFLNCDDNLNSSMDKHFIQNRPAGPHPLVLYKDPLGEGKWEGPVDLLTWGRGYACVSIPTGPLWLPAKRVKPYHNRPTPTTDVAVCQDSTAGTDGTNVPKDQGERILPPEDTDSEEQLPRSTSGSNFG